MIEAEVAKGFDGEDDPNYVPPPPPLMMQVFAKHVANAVVDGAGALCDRLAELPYQHEFSGINYLDPSELPNVWQLRREPNLLILPTASNAGVTDLIGHQDFYFPTDEGVVLLGSDFDQ